ncbi:MAG: hypothetical protein ACK4KV_08765 [Rhodocyclaceae bacterium]
MKTVVASLAAAMMLVGCSVETSTGAVERAPTSDASSATEVSDAVPTASVEVVSVEQTEAGSAGTDNGVRDAKEAAEDAARKIRDAAVKLKDAGVGAVQSVRDATLGRADADTGVEADTPAESALEIAEGSTDAE